MLTTSPLRIDERVLHYLTGVAEMDERMSEIIEPVPPFEDLEPSHRAIVARAADAWLAQGGRGSFPVVQLYGEDSVDKRAVASAACGAAGLNLCALPAAAVPSSTAELDVLIRLWEREAALSSSALLVECDGMEFFDGARVSAVRQLIDHSAGPVIISTRERRGLTRRPCATFEVRKPTADERSR